MRECVRYIFQRCCGGCGCLYWSVLRAFAVTTAVFWTRIVAKNGGPGARKKQRKRRLRGNRRKSSGATSVRTITQAVRHFAWGGRANGNQLVPQAEANVVSQNLLVGTSRKEISWCNKARLRGASTSRARAKVWAQLPGPGPRAWGSKAPG